MVGMAMGDHGAVHRPRRVDEEAAGLAIEALRASTRSQVSGCGGMDQPMSLAASSWGHFTSGKDAAPPWPRPKCGRVDARTSSSGISTEPAAMSCVIQDRLRNGISPRDPAPRDRLRCRMAAELARRAGARAHGGGGTVPRPRRPCARDDLAGRPLHGLRLLQQALAGLHRPQLAQELGPAGPRGSIPRTATLPGRPMPRPSRHDANSPWTTASVGMTAPGAGCSTRAGPS